MADPYSAIIGTAADAVTGIASGIPYLIPTASDKENKKRLKELKRLRDLNALGLTEAEKQDYFSALNQAAQASREDITSKMESGTQAFNTGASGRELALAKAGEEAMGRIGTTIGQAVKQEDIARADAQRQELEDRLAAKAARDQQMASAAISMFMPILGSMTEKGALNQTTSQKSSGAATAARKLKTPEEQDIEDAELSDWSWGSGSGVTG